MAWRGARGYAQEEDCVCDVGGRTELAERVHGEARLQRGLVPGDARGDAGVRQPRRDDIHPDVVPAVCACAHDTRRARWLRLPRARGRRARRECLPGQGAHSQQTVPAPPRPPWRRRSPHGSRAWHALAQLAQRQGARVRGARSRASTGVTPRCRGCPVRRARAGRMLTRVWRRQRSRTQWNLPSASSSAARCSCSLSSQAMPPMRGCAAGRETARGGISPQQRKAGVEVDA